MLILIFILLLLIPFPKLGNLETGQLQSFLLLSIMLLFSFLFVYQTMNPFRRNKEKEKTVSTLKCVNCKYTEQTEFVEGQYIGEIVKKCPKCGGDVMVQLIYVETGEKKR